MDLGIMDTNDSKNESRQRVLKSRELDVAMPAPHCRETRQQLLQRLESKVVEYSQYSLVGLGVTCLTD